MGFKLGMLKLEKALANNGPITRSRGLATAPGVSTAPSASTPSSAFPVDSVPVPVISVPTSGPRTTPAKDATATKPVAETIKRKGTLPLIGQLPFEQQLRYLGMLAGLMLLLTVLVVVVGNRDSRIVGDYQISSAQLQYHSQRVAKAADGATRGNQAAFAQLQESRAKFSSNLNALVNGGDLTGGAVPPAGGDAQNVLTDIQKRWALADKQAAILVAAKPDLINLGKNVSAISSGSSQLVEISDELVGLLLQAGGSTSQLLAAEKLASMAQRMGRGASELLAGETDNPEVTFLLGKDVNGYRDTLKALDEGSDMMRIAAVREAEAKAKLDQLKLQFQKFAASADNILQNIQKLTAARQASVGLFNGSEPLQEDLDKLEKVFSGGSSVAWTWAALLVGLFTLSLLGLIAFVVVADARRRSTEVEEENKRNQEAILRLLNEMGDLADGDLTVRAKVTEDITGAIADSMNYTIEELRSLVTGVNFASTQVAERTQEARQVSVGLLAAAERQSKEIQSTSAKLLEVSRSINNVSENANETAKVAGRSLTAAQKGQEAVQNSISGMNEIREHIQETSNLIKLLGESSQEICEIVELISDITEQTNVLALNAAIQAASAGEAGRGFSVVAEEVQRLAERSAEATKQIGAIVKTIQSDTQDAVSAMERSTQGVVEGAKLSDAAGQALSEIGDVSRQLADLIESISRQAQLQASATNQVADNMQGILEITKQTTNGTQQTAASIQNLAEVAKTLKSSVSGFRL
ncbi:MAG: type IV pili methyl-accepting chemotaxis transducer N-terminal domain-containing protein [Burkholderiales bacterium]|nr:type IV pili methyl-accepting chemotaxis transducer N-terminal domain-containing protein [Burkholderiales bacterium]